MKKVLVDLNIIIDVLWEREPFVKEAAWFWTLAESSSVTAFLSATSVTNLYYILRRTAGSREARSILRKVLEVFPVAPVNQKVVARALELRYGDFEDAVQESCARHSRLEAIITRNKKDFRYCVVPVYTPAEFVAIFFPSRLIGP